MFVNVRKLTNYIFAFFIAFLLPFGLMAQKTLKISSICVFDAADSSIFSQKKVNRRFSEKNVNSYIEKKIQFFADNGYPFAKILLDSVCIENFRIKYYYKLEKNKFYIVENIFLPSENQIFSMPICDEIGIFKNTPFCYSKIKNISNVLSYSELYSQTSSPSTEYHSTGADVFLYLKKKHANYVSGLVSIDYDQEKGEYFPSGNMCLNLKNNIGHGEKFYFLWKGYSHGCQNLVVDIVYPYIFKTFATACFSVDYVKTDSVALNTNLVGGFDFRICSGFSVGLYFKTKKLMHADTIGNIYKVSSLFYGASFKQKILLEKFLTNFCATFYLGNRKTALEKQSTFCSELSLVGKLPVYNKFSIDFNYNSQLDFCESEFYYYEKNTFGGALSLRGFDENYFRADCYATMQNNLRFQTAENINFLLFYDFGCYSLKINDLKVNDCPMSFGFGLGFVANEFYADISWAAAREFNKLLPLRNSKINLSLRLIF